METTTLTSCNTSTLDPFVPTGQNDWTTARVKHAYRRLGLSAHMNDVDTALALSPNDFIDSLVDGAAALPPTATPFWGYYTVDDFVDFEADNPQYIYDWRIQSGTDILNEDLRGRMAFFWMNHFVTQLETYFYSPYLFQHYNMMQTHALGNFKDFVHAVGIDPAMLFFLNGFQNTNFNPNENYARELYELFTLGEGNGYTENDITETSRALTGWNHWNSIGGAIFFDESTWDSGSKTIFDQEGEWRYDDVIDILFAQRPNEIATHICTKLYRFFVSPEINQTVEDNIITPLAQTFVANNFELVPVLKQLFKSEHFFDERAIGVVIKSPIDMIFGYVNETGFFYNGPIMDAFLYYASLVGQEIFQPPDVAGWEGDEAWINTSTLTGRWEFMGIYVDFLLGNGFELSLTDLAKDLTNDSNDPAYITQVMIDHFVPKGLHTASDYDDATEVLKWEVPQNYYDDGLWNLDWPSAPFQVSLLLKHLSTLPEFQLK